jgi:predicted RNA-binding Zn ribbon-like protein
MDALQLEPRAYEGTYKLIGGRLAFDFVNTVSYRGLAAEHDWLWTPRNVVRWCVANHLPVLGAGRIDLGTVHDLRDLVLAVVHPVTLGRHPERVDVTRFSEAVVSALQRRSIDPTTLQWVWAKPESTADCFSPVLCDAAEIITSADPARLSACPGCDWLFEDHTRNRGRRWCDMADCGSRAKSRDYYYRTKPTVERGESSTT